MSVFLEFPAIDEGRLRALRLFIDTEFRAFTRAHGETLETLFNPLRDFLLASERLLTTSPWPLVVGAIGLLAWLWAPKSSWLCSLVWGWLATSHSGCSRSGGNAGGSQAGWPGQSA